MNIRYHIIIYSILKLIQSNLMANGIMSPNYYYSRFAVWEWSMHMLTCPRLESCRVPNARAAAAAGTGTSDWVM